MPSKIWSCKIGEVADADVPQGGDAPMRDAVYRAFERVTGKVPQFCFSGWAAELTEGERACVEDRLPAPPTGLELIGWERERQVESEGWTSEHDDEHDRRELAKAAASYALHAGTGGPGAWRTANGGPMAPQYWPWEAESWKPGDDPVRDLAKAGALIAAEIDRLQRAADTPTDREEGR